VGCAIVTRGTIVTDAVVAENSGTKHCRGVAKVTILAGGQMVYGGILAGGKLAVVATFAAIGDTLMIKHTSAKTADDMACRTVLRGGDMIQRLTNGGRAIVARGTVIDDTGVIKHRSEKGTGYVTDTAIFAGGQVRGMLTGCRDTVVASGAIIDDAGMIKHTGGKCRNAMTHAAILGRGDVC
jgi:hypothetical protein